MSRKPIDIAREPSLSPSEDPDLLQIAWSAARMGAWQLDPDTMAMSCSAQCKANFGLREDEPLDYARLTGELIHPDDRERMRATLQAAVESRGDYDIEYRAVWPDRSLHWIVARGRASCDAAGHPRRMVGVTLDVTDHKRLERLALEQSRLLELVIAGRPRGECLIAITATIAALHPGARACVLLANEARDAIAEVLSADIPSSFGQALIGAPISDMPVGTCGTAIHSGEPVTCSDVGDNDHWWTGWRQACLAHGIHACHSTPVFDGSGTSIGSFFLCFGQAHEPDPWELRLAAFGAHVASVVLERDRSHLALRDSQSLLQEELADSELLQRLSVAMAGQEDAQGLYDKIVEAAATIMHSGFASMQMLDPDRGDSGELRLLASRGFSPASMRFWAWVRPDSASLCGAALRSAERVVVRDVTRSDMMAGSGDLAAFADNGIRAAQATPLFSRNGRLVGMLSTHWDRPHTPPGHDLRRLDILCRQAADLIERQQSAAALRVSETRYRSLFDSIDEGFCVIEVLFDDDGTACDYRFIEVNPAFERHSGLRGATGRRVREINPAHEQHWFDIYGAVARSGRPARFRNEAAGLHRWFDVYAFRTGAPGDNTVAALFTDITARKIGDDALRESETRFRHMANQSPMMVWMTGDDGQCSFLSQSWYAFTGQAEAAGLGRGWLDPVHPEDRERVFGAFLAANAGAESFQVEYRLRRHDGDYRWVLTAAAPRIDDAGRMLGFIGSVLDIHERKQAEDDTQFLFELSERIRKARDIDRLMADTTAAVAGYLRVSRCYFAEIFEDRGCWRVVHDHHHGLPSIAGDYPISMFDVQVLEEMRSGRVLVSEDTSTDPRSAARYHDAYEPIGVRAQAIVPLLRDGRWVSNLVAAADTPRQWRTRELGLLETVAERVWNARERLQSEQSLRDADRRKDEFLATLAHELRNPLAPLRNCMQILRMQNAQIDRTELHAIMERQMTQLVRLVDDLLEVSRITRGKISLRREPVDVADVIGRAVETSRPAIDAAGHTLDVDLPRQPLHLHADPLRLAQVLSNLLNNAAKYTEPGGRIVLAAQRDGDQAVLTVHDNGLGIAPEYLGDVFDLFAQADHSLTRAQGGLGIGLTLVRNLVELHGGSVKVRSEGLGQGSEFEVRLPLPDNGDAAPAGNAEPTAVNSTEDERYRVLLVDDNHEHADSLALFLRMSGHHVRTAYDGIEGVSAAATFDPDAVLLDIGMPRLDGYEACRRIRSQPGGDARILIALTGWGQEEDRRRGEAAGFDEHLVKPVDPDGLLRMMDSLGRKKRQEAPS